MTVTYRILLLVLLFCAQLDAQSENRPQVLDLVKRLRFAPTNTTLLGELHALAMTTKSNEDPIILSICALGYLCSGNQHELLSTQQQLQRFPLGSTYLSAYTDGTFLVECAYCTGKGIVISSCPACRGSGVVEYLKGAPPRTCLTCMGKQTREKVCTHCNGKKQEFENQIPLFLYQKLLDLVLNTENVAYKDWETLLLQISSRKTLLKEKICIRGKVLQKLSDGLLVRSTADEYANELRTHIGISGGTIVPYCMGTPIYPNSCFLRDHPKYDMLVDDYNIQVLAYPDGQYQYVAVYGGQRTVRAFSCNIWNCKLAKMP